MHTLYGRMKIDDITTDGPWYGVKCVFLHRDAPKQGEGQVFEERIVLIRATSTSEAIQRGEVEAEAYARANEAEYLGFIDTFHLFTDHVGSGTEVYSLMRTSPLAPKDFVTKYFDDGTQHSGTLDEQ